MMCQHNVYDGDHCTRCPYGIARGVPSTRAEAVALSDKRKAKLKALTQRLERSWHNGDPSAEYDAQNEVEELKKILLDLFELLEDTL